MCTSSASTNRSYYVEVLYNRRCFLSSGAGDIGRARERERKTKTKTTRFLACLVVRIEEAVPKGEVDHNQGAVGFPLCEVGLDALQRLLHRHKQKLFHLLYCTLIQARQRRER